MKKAPFVLLIVLFIIPLLATACGDAPQAQNGDTVQVEYTGTLEDGSQFDTSIGREPLEFILGEDRMIPGFEQAVLGMKVGESKTVTIPADDAYGPYNDELTKVVNREELPEGMSPVVGQQLRFSSPDGSVIQVTVIEVTDETITVDANHPLAGKDLTFEIELVQIN